MKSRIQFIQNATLVLNYAGKRLLMDPMFAEKGAYPGFPGTANSELRNPLVEMPVEPESLIDVDAVLVSHLHPDHWDKVAVQTLPKQIKVLAKDDEDANTIRSQGFTNVEVLEKDANFEGLHFQQTYCQHGPDAAYEIPELAEFLGEPAGYYFNEEDEKSIYFLGDTVWIDQVENNLKTWQPDVVVVNTGYARMEDENMGAILTGKKDVQRVHEFVPEATIIAIHMEELNHCLLSRKELKEYAEEKGFSENLIIPEDGEVINL